MEIRRLKAGAFAPLHADFIRVDALWSGRLSLMGSAGGEHAEIVDLGVHEKLIDAEAAGLKWADSEGVKELFVETCP